MEDKPKNGIRKDFGVYIKGVHKPQDTENLEKGLKIMLDKFMTTKKMLKYLQWKCKHYHEKLKRFEDMEIAITKGDTLVPFKKLEYYKNIEALYLRSCRAQALLAT